jgi:hypothetical protein
MIGIIIIRSGFSKPSHHSTCTLPKVEHLHLTPRFVPGAAIVCVFSTVSRVIGKDITFTIVSYRASRTTFVPRAKILRRAQPDVLKSR